jgi:hypothetical protein
VLTLDSNSNGVTQIAQQMPAVSNLNRIRRSLTYAIGIGPSPIARDDLNTRVMSQPLSQAFSLPIRQQVNDRIALQVNKDRPVATAATPRPVIDGEDARHGSGCCRLVGLANQPE